MHVYVSLRRSNIEPSDRFTVIKGDVCVRDSHVSKLECHPDRDVICKQTRRRNHIRHQNQQETRQKLFSPTHLKQAILIKYLTFLYISIFTHWDSLTHNSFPYSGHWQLLKLFALSFHTKFLQTDIFYFQRRQLIDSEAEKSAEMSLNVRISLTISYSENYRLSSCACWLKRDN